jgi:energy-coupling factor transporter transmembrane protein EcfT
VKESFTAAIVVRSLWAALGVVWVTGLLVGWVVDRGDWVWLVSWDVVVAVDIEWFLFLVCEGGWERD